MPGLANVAGALGLRVVAVPEGAVVGAGFGALRRATSGPAVSGAATSTWLVGERGGVGVVVRTETIGIQFYTSVVVEIAPPLFVGLRVWQHGFGRFDAPPGAAVQLWGDFMVLARDEARARLVLAEDGSLDALRALARLGHIGVQDGFVEVMLPSGADGEEHVRAAVDRAAELAGALARRVAGLPWHKADAERARQWETFAVNEGLDIDHVRRRMRGRVDGVEVEISSDPAPNAVYTTTLARFRWALGAGLWLRRDPRGLLVARRSPALDGVSVGERDFDAQFIVDAAAPARAVELLRDPGAREELARLASVNAHLVMNDREVIVASMAWLGPADLWSATRALVRLVDRVTPEAKVGPYR